MRNECPSWYPCVIVIDVGPTILEAAGIRQPSSVDGVVQRPMEGTSFFYTFDKANANAPTRHTIQYFSMLGVPGIYKDGWMASVIPVCMTSDPNCKNPDSLTPWTNAKWELFNVDTDWTQNDDVAAQYPDKLEQLKQVFVDEVNKYNVFPLNADRPAMALSQRPGLKAGQTRFEYHSAIENLTSGLVPNLLNVSYTIADGCRRSSEVQRHHRHARRPLRRLRARHQERQAVLPLQHASRSDYGVDRLYADRRRNA